jgi:Uma2 family endonuclease
MLARQDDYISPDEYLRIDRESQDIKYEYMDGRMYAMAGGTIDHDQICNNMVMLLRPPLQGRCRLFTNVRLQTQNTKYFYPDITISCNPVDWQGRGKKDIVHMPRFIIEVLSPSTEVRDRGEKLFSYRRIATLQEYVLINTKYQAVEIYQRQEDVWTYRQFDPGQEVEFASLELSFPMAALYEFTEVPTIFPHD